jgi:hypothetical protein
LKKRSFQIFYTDIFTAILIFICILNLIIFLFILLLFCLFSFYDLFIHMKWDYKMNSSINHQLLILISFFTIILHTVTIHILIFIPLIFIRLFFDGYFHEDRNEPIMPFWPLDVGDGEDLKKLVEVVFEEGAFEGVDKFNNSSLICCLRNLWLN